MRIFIISILTIMALESMGKLVMVHKITQDGKHIVRKPGDLLVDVVFTFAFIAWGICVLK